MRNRRYAIALAESYQLHAFGDFVREQGDDSFKRIYVNSDLMLNDKETLSYCEKLSKSMKDTEWILSLPEILRGQDKPYLDKVVNLISASFFTGVLTGSLEGVGYFTELKQRQNELGGDKKKDFKLYGDHNLYAWNHLAVEHWKESLDGVCLPLELPFAEQRELLMLDFSWEKLIYGRIPMMLTANCVAKTENSCQKAKREKDDLFTYIKDRKGVEFPVKLQCEHCFNVIYNSVPLSLHDEVDSMDDKVLLRLQFTTEDQELTKKVLRFFNGNGNLGESTPFYEYTRGREKRGAL